MAAEASPSKADTEENEKVDTLPSDVQAGSSLNEAALPIQAFQALQSDVVLKCLEGALAASGDPAFCFNDLMACVVRETRADLALLFGYREAPQEWFLLSSVGMPPTFGKQSLLPRGWQSLSAIISHEASHALFSEDISKDRRFVGQMVRGTAVCTFAGALLEIETRCFGSLIMGFNAPSALTDEDNALFLSFSKQLCACLARQNGSPSDGPSAPIISLIETTAPLPSVAAAEEASTPIVPVETRRAEVAAPAPLPTEPKGDEPVLDKAPSRGAGPRDEHAKTDRNRRTARPTPSSGPQSSPAPQGSSRPQQRSQSPSRPHGASHTAGEADVQVPILEALLASLAAVFQGEDFSKGVLRKIVLSMEADGGYLFRWDSTRQRLFPLASEGVTQDITRRIWRSGVRPDPLWGRIIDKHQPMLIPSENGKTPLKKKLYGEDDVQSQIAVPIGGDSETWGLLILFNRSSALSQKELRLLELVGEKMGLAVHASLQWEALAHKVDMAAAVQDFFRTVTYGNLSSLLDRLCEILRASNAYLFRVDEQRSFLVGCAGSANAPEEIVGMEIRMEENTIGPLAVRQGQPLAVEHAPSDSRVDRKWIEMFRSRSLCAIPLIVKEQVTGVLLFDETAYFRRFTQAEIQTAVALSYPAAVAIETALQYQEAVRHCERQETLARAVLRTQEEERCSLAGILEQETGKFIETARKSLRDAATLMTASLPVDSPLLTQLAENSTLLENVARDMKTLLADLSADGLEKQGLLAAIRAAAQRFSALTGIPATVHLPASIKHTSPGFERLLYRIVQEALENIKKHAEATSVLVSMESKDLYWQLSLTDNGRGFDAHRYFALSPAKRKGVGIAGMKARADLVGGTFFIESATQQGTRLSVKIPVKQDGSGFP